MFGKNFGRKTIDDAISLFKQACDDLDQIAADKSIEANDLAEESALLNAQSVMAGAEAHRARVLHDRIKGLIEVHA